MTPRARRTGAATLLLLAASCTGPQSEPRPVAGAAPACRVGPDGGPVGGRIADRGIGGTGAPLADRGIGGTGIVGVITGFGSVCVNGQEVGLDGATPVAVDAAGSDASALRAGQLAVVEAGGANGSLLARSVLVRHEVSGPVESATPGRLRVAGQDVTLTEETWVVRPPAVGDWVAVSGLVRPDGVVEATRVDPRLPGPVLVHGVLRRENGRLRIGALPVAPVPATAALVGQEVTASGVLLGAELQPDTIEPDRLLADPGGYFGAGVTALLVEGFVGAEGGRVRLGPAILPAASGFFVAVPGRAVVAFSRGTGGWFDAVSAGSNAPGASTPAPGGLRGLNEFAPRQGDRSGRERSGGGEAGLGDRGANLNRRGFGPPGGAPRGPGPR